MPAPLYRMRDSIQMQVVHLQHRLHRPIPAAQNHTNARRKLRHRKRFCHVVMMLASANVVEDRVRGLDAGRG